MLEKDLILKITALVENISYKINYCSAIKYYSYKIRRGNLPSYLINLDDPNNICDKIVKMDINLINNDNIYEIVRKINEEFDVDSFVMQDSNSDDRHICVMPKGINKKNTLQKLSNKLNISREEIVFFWDGLNDIEIMG